MNIEQSLNLQDLNSSLTLIRGVAVIADEVLLKEIDTTIGAFKRINTPKSRAILSVVEPAFEAAKAIWGKAERASELKAIATWLTNVQIGWL